MNHEGDHRLMRFKARPEQQVRALLDCFESVHTQRFDLHVRRPPPVGADVTAAKWITCHENLDAARLMLLWRWLKHENIHGAEVYFRPHHLQRHPVIFLDDLSVTRATTVARRYTCAVVQTSPDNTQVWLNTATAFDKHERKLAQAHLSGLGYSDPGSISGDHLGRMCGLRSHKRGCWVNTILFSTPRAYAPSLQETTRCTGGGGACASSHQGSGSPSEKEFGWTIGMLRAGVKSDSLASRLQQTAKDRGKRNAERYARLTVRRAKEALNICSSLTGGTM